MQADNKKIAKNTIALYIRMAITTVVSFLTVRVTLQVLGSEDYGLNNLVGSIVAMFSFINGSMGTAVQRFYSYEIGKNNEQRLAKVFGAGMYLHICIALITLLIGEFFAILFLHYLNIPQERMFAAHVVFQISLFSLVCNILNVPYAAMLRAREDFTKFASLDILQALGRFVILYLLYIISFDKLITLSLLNACITLSYIGGVILLARKYPESKFHVERDKTLIKEMTGFISLLLFTVLFSILRDKGIVVLINLFFGLAINAAYAIAAQIMHLASSFAMNFKQALVPQLMAAYSSSETGRMNQLINTGTKITYVLMLLITMPVIFEPYFVLDIILADVPDYASTFTTLILINVNLSSFTYFLYQAVHATGRIKGQQTYMSALYFINILMIYIMFKFGFNCYSALYVTIVCSLIQCVVNIIYAHKTFAFNVGQFVESIVSKSVLIALIATCALSVLYFIKNDFLRFSLRFVVSTTIILLESYYLYFDKQEKAYCTSMIRRLFNKTIN